MGFLCLGNPPKKDHPGMIHLRETIREGFLCNKLSTVIIENRVELQSPEYRKQLFFLVQGEEK